MSSGKEKIDVSRPGLRSLNGLTFDDVLILPRFTDIRPDQTDTSLEILPGMFTGLPIWAAPMRTVWSEELTIAMAECGAIAPLHRELDDQELQHAIDGLSKTEIVSNKEFKAATVSGRAPIIVSTSPFDEERIRFLVNNKAVDFIIFDTVQPYSPQVLNAVGKFSQIAPQRIIVGNVATAEAAQAFCKYDIAALKVGLGAGSICTTRAITGVGVPQLEALQEVSKIANRVSIPIISDGGVRKLGDIAKAIAAGATSVMMGNLFAGTKESCGEIVNLKGKKYKKYSGSKYKVIRAKRNQKRFAGRV